MLLNLWLSHTRPRFISKENSQCSSITWRYVLLTYECWLLCCCFLSHPDQWLPDLLLYWTYDDDDDVLPSILFANRWLSIRRYIFLLFFLYTKLFDLRRLLGVHKAHVLPPYKNVDVLIMLWRIWLDDATISVEYIFVLLQFACLFSQSTHKSREKATSVFPNACWDFVHFSWKHFRLDFYLFLRGKLI